MRNIKNNEKGVAPLLLLLGLVGLGLGGGVVFAIAPHMMMIYFLFAGFFLVGLIALKSGPKTLKLIIPLFVIVVVMVLIFSFIPLPWLSIAPPADFNNAKTEEFEEKSFRGHGNPNWGSETLDSIRYITSPEKDSDSEKVVTSGGWCRIEKSVLYITAYRYVLYLYDGGWKEEEVKEHDVRITEGNPALGECWYTPAEIFSIPYGQDGFAKMELEVEIVHTNWYVLVKDTAWVKEGKAEVSWLKTRYEVGETAQLEYRTGYCLSSKNDNPESGNCYLRVFSYGKGEYVIDQVVPQNTKKIVEYKVTMADFSTDAGCQNYLKATIENKLVEIDDDETTVIDFAELGPSKPTIKTDKASYTVGDTIHIEFKSKVNSETKLPIEKYHIQISYIEPTVVLVDEWTTSTEYSFSGTVEKGTIAIEVFCQDEGCRPSEINTKFVKVYEKGNPLGDLPIPWMVILLLLVMLVIGIAIMYFVKGVPLPIKLIVLIILLIIPLALWWWGVIY
jgi:hypothetical protein